MTDPAPAVHTLRNGVGDPFGGDHQGRQMSRQCFRPMMRSGDPLGHPLAFQRLT